MISNHQIGEFDCFVELYSRHQIWKHYPNPHWQTKDQVIELSGGIEQLYSIYCLWTEVSIQRQHEMCWCTREQTQWMLHTIATFNLEDNDETLSHLAESLARLGVL